MFTLIPGVGGGSCVELTGSVELVLVEEWLAWSNWKELVVVDVSWWSTSVYGVRLTDL